MRVESSVFLGVDIGKSAHYAVAVDRSGTIIHSASVANTESDLRTLVDWAQEHQAELVVDQPGGTAALLLTLCWSASVPVGYLHGTAMARAREFYPGESKTDPKDAFVLADIARAHPRRIVRLAPSEERRARLELRCGYDEDLRADANRLTNRLRSLLAASWPALERALDARLDSLPTLTLLRTYPTAPALRKAGRSRLVTLLRKHRGRGSDQFADTVLSAARAQSVTVPGSDTAGSLIREIADQLIRILRRRASLADEIAADFAPLPESEILLSLPGIGPRLGARIAVEIGSIARFATASQLAAYAGLGPAPHTSGTSIRGTTAHHHGNHRLKNAFFLAAFASLRHAPSRAYYDKKRGEGKRHNQAILCLARRRVDVLHAMLASQTCYALPAPKEDTLPRSA